MSGPAAPGSDSLPRALASLGYDERWIRYGFITPEMVLRQHADFLTGDPYCQETEHLRLRAFAAWLLYRVRFTDEEVDRYLELLQLDPDQTMALSELLCFLNEPELTDAQFDRAADVALRHGAKPEVVRFHRLARKRERVGWSETDLRDAVASPHSATHAMLLDSDVPWWIVEQTAITGASKSVRQRAQQLLRTRQRGD